MRLTPPAVRLALFVLILGSSLVAVPTASALTVTRDGNVITITAAAGEDNNVTIADTGGNARVTEANNGVTATLVAGAGCAAPVGNSTDCGMAATVTQINVFLSDLDDTYNGNLGANTAPNVIDFGAGRDTGSGHTGNDTLNLGSGSDTSVNGEAGNDTINGDVGNDQQLNGGGGDDTLTGGDGNDSLDAGDGNNTLDGGEGDDFLQNGLGTDQLLAGPGNDNFGFSGFFWGPDTIDGGPGRDSVNWFQHGDPLSLSLDGVANDGEAGQNANLISIESLLGGTAGDTIVGSAGAETLSGDAGADIIEGGGGNDTINGGSQNDTLRGGDGSDGVYGDNGDDAMDGGTGNDLLYGYDGADDLVGGDGRDTVDFGGGSLYNGASVTLDNQANDGAEGEGDNAHSDNENIIGTGGPDVLVGGPGVNVISGGGGYDTIIIREGGPAAASRDTALCGADEDTVLADPTDQIGSGAEHCENVSYGDVTGYGPVVGVTANGKNAGQRGTVPLVLRCPLSARGGCEGTATLRVRGRRAGRVRFSMRAGQELERDLKLSKRAVNAVNGSRRAIRAPLTVQAEDELGATSTATKNVRLTK